MTSTSSLIVAVFLGGVTLLAVLLILILTGEDDGNPSPEMADRMDAALTAAGTVHEMVLYPGAAHAFMSKGGDSYREHPATDGWRRALEWIDRYL